MSARRLAVGLLLLVAAPAVAAPPPCPTGAVTCLEENDADAEPPSVAARESAPPQRRGFLVGGVEVAPGYMHFLERDWLGANVALSVGGEAPSGFAALLRVGLFAGENTYQIPFQHWTFAVAFVVPTGTRVRITLGHEFGLFVLQEPHSAEGGALSFSMGGFAQPTVDLWRHDFLRLYALGRFAYDFVFADGSNDVHALSVSLGIGFAL